MVAWADDFMHLMGFMAVAVGCGRLFHWDYFMDYTPIFMGLFRYLEVVKGPNCMGLMHLMIFMHAYFNERSRNPNWRCLPSMMPMKELEMGLTRQNSISPCSLATFFR